MLNSHDFRSLYTPMHPNDIEETFTRIATEQVATFRAMGGKIDGLEDVLQNIGNSLMVLDEKIKLQRQEIECQKIRALRDKQNTFIINSLQEKVAKMNQSEELLQQEIEQKQRKCIDLEIQLEEQKRINTEFRDQLQQRKVQLKQIIKVNQSLKNQRMVEPEHLPTFGQSPIRENKHDHSGLSNIEYEELQTKIQQIEEELTEQIEQEKKKNKKLQQKNCELNAQVKEDSGLKRKVYELELKLQNALKQNKQIQHSYAELLEKSNSLQISIHQKTAECKNLVMSEKKNLKRYKNEVDKQIKNFAGAVLEGSQNSLLFVGTKELSDKFMELKKQLLKERRKAVKMMEDEKELRQQELIVKIQQKDKDLKGMQSELAKIRKQKAQKLEKISVNSSITSKSQNKSQKNVKDSIKQQKQNEKIDLLSQKLSEAQGNLARLRRQYDDLDTQLNQKMMRMEAQLTKKDLQINYFKTKVEKVEKLQSKSSSDYKQMKQKFQEEVKLKNKSTLEKVKELKEKLSNVQNQLAEKQRQKNNLESKLKSYEQKKKRFEQKLQKKQQEIQKTIKAKDDSIDELIKKNQSALVQNKLLKEKLQIMQISGKEANDQAETKQLLVRAKSRQSQLSLQNQRLQVCLKKKQSQIKEIMTRVETRQKKDEEVEQKLQRANSQNQQLLMKNKILQNENDALKQSIGHYKESRSKDSKESFSQLKEQFDRKYTTLKKESQKIISELKKNKKQLEEKLRSYKSDSLEQKEQKLNEVNIELFREREKNRKETSELKNLIEQLKKQQKSQKQEQIQQLSLPKKNGPTTKDNQPSLKMTNSFELVDEGVMTDSPQRNQIGINTVDMFEAELRASKEAQEGEKLGFNILDQEYLNMRDQDESLPEILIQDEEEKSVAQKQKQVQQIRSSNLFMSLKKDTPADEDVFQICEEGEEVNFGQSASNLELRELFSYLRREIEKVFNEEEVSMEVIKFLPAALQDDYYELLTYIKQKISTIKSYNQISFIMAEPGKEPEPEEESLDLPDLIDRRTTSDGELKRVIEEKEALINSLMNDKVSQENTINQLTMEKQEMEEQNQNKFMNQCNIYKREIKEHKKQIDMFEMNFQSLVNIIKNVLEIYSEDYEQEEDYRDNMTMLARIAKLSEKDRSRINFYIHKYREMKGVASQA